MGKTNLVFTIEGALGENGPMYTNKLYELTGLGEKIAGRRLAADAAVPTVLELVRDPGPGKRRGIMKSKDSWEQEIRALEESHLDPEVRGSREAMAALLADDFVQFGDTGNISANKQEIVEALARTPFIRASLSDFQAKRLAPNVVLTTYRVVRSDESGQPLKHSLRSSVWKHMDGRWQLVFHQGTLTSPPGE